MVGEELASAVVPQPGQHYKMVKQAGRSNTFQPSRGLLTGGDRGIHTPWR